MPNLALPIEGYQDDTVADPNGYALPIAQTVPVDIPRVVIDTSEKKPKLKEVEHDPWETGKKAIDKLFGLNGQERYQLWPEKVLREGISAAGDTMQQGTLAPGLRREDFTDIPAPNMPTNDSTWLGKAMGVAPVAASPADSIIEKAQAMSALAGTGGLAGADATLGSGPMLRPALKYKDKIYKAPVGGQHLDALPPELYSEFQKLAMSGEDINHYNFGFMNHKGQFLDREKALDYAIKEGLVDPHAGQYGALTSTLLADSSKPGTAIEAMAKSQPFFSALEHNVKQINQAKMNGDAWLGTLANKPGVKPEELQWTGLKDFLEENKGKPVTKAQIEEHLANNKVELKEVEKGELKFNKNSEYALPEVIKAAKEAGDNPGELEMVLANDGNAYRALTKKFPHLSEDEDWAAKVSQSVFGGDSMPTGTTKYHSYQLPGGENYREKLLTLPEKVTHTNPKIVKSDNSNYPWKVDFTVNGEARYQVFKTEAEAKAHSDYVKTADTSKEGYRSSHWDEPNILAHVRMNDRTIDGKKSLHLEEIQSDWHQQGRDKGYKENLKPEDITVKHIASKVPEGADPSNYPGYWESYDKKGNMISRHRGNSTAEEAKAEALRSAELLSNRVPDAPFKKTWHELALKRMIREAAEKGYDRLSWTPGEAQAARYDLSKSLDKVQYHADKHRLVGIDKNGGVVMDKEGIAPNQVADFVGKDVAKKLLESEPAHIGTIHELRGANLTVGGEGMKGFYDQIIPKSLEKISGQKVKQAGIESNEAGWHLTPPEHTVSGKWMVKSSDYNSKGLTFDTKSEAEAALKSKMKSNPVHYIDLPQALKDKAMGTGFPLFSAGLPLVPVDHDPWKKKK